MKKIYFGFGIADSMFPENCLLTKEKISVEDIKKQTGIISCLNPSHKATIKVMNERYGLNIDIPEKAPIIKMEDMDSIIVMAVSGLPRLEGRHEYTEKEINDCEFKFSKYTLIILKGDEDEK